MRGLLDIGIFCSETREYVGNIVAAQHDLIFALESPFASTNYLHVGHSNEIPNNINITSYPLPMNTGVM